MAKSWVSGRTLDELLDHPQHDCPDERNGYCCECVFEAPVIDPDLTVVKRLMRAPAA